MQVARTCTTTVSLHVTTSLENSNKSCMYTIGPKSLHYVWKHRYYKPYYRFILPIELSALIVILSPFVVWLTTPHNLHLGAVLTTWTLYEDQGITTAIWQVSCYPGMCAYISIPSHSQYLIDDQEGAHVHLFALRVCALTLTVFSAAQVCLEWLCRL